MAFQGLRYMVKFLTLRFWDEYNQCLTHLSKVLSLHNWGLTRFFLKRPSSIFTFFGQYVFDTSVELSTNGKQSLAASH